MDMAGNLGNGFYKIRGALIIPVEGSIIKVLVKSDPKTKIGERIQKQRVIFKEVRDKPAYDPEYQAMRKNGGK